MKKVPNRQHQFPAVAGTGGINAIATIHLPMYLQELKDKTVASQITTNQFETDFKKGDTVEFYFSGEVANYKWSKGQDYRYDEITDDVAQVVIDRARQWGFISHHTDDMWSMIQNYKGEFKQKAIDRVQRDIDKEVFDEWVLAAQVFGEIRNRYDFGMETSSIELSTDNGLKILNNINTVAMEENWDINQVFAVVPPWFLNLLASGDLRRADMMGTGQPSPIFTGPHVLGQERVSGVTLINSNLLPEFDSGADSPGTKIIFGTKRAFSLAVAIEMMGTKDDKDNPSCDYNYGLTVYGMNSVWPGEMGVIYAHPGDGVFSVK